MDVGVTELNSIKGKVLKVFHHTVACLGVGSLRDGEYDGKPCLVKWFSKEDLIKIGCRMQLYRNLRDHLLQVTPGEQLLWPVDISEVRDEAFGYVTYHDLSSYRSLADIMESTTNYENCEAIVNAASCLVSAFAKIRQRNYYFLHMTEEDIFIHPKSGRLMITNVEFLRKKTEKIEPPSEEKEEWKPTVVSRLFPPVCIKKERIPNEHSDYYLLSVLLFEILYLNHPLEGHHAVMYPVMGEKEKTEVYGIRPCFVYDKTDSSNRPVRGIHINMRIRRNMYPRYIQEIFSRVFSQKALKKGLVYSAVENWDRLFERLRKHIAVCPYCGMDYFQQSGKHLICRKCQKPLVSPEIEACDSAERTDDLGWTDG